ncbi:MAG TPA: putative glycoside hydrolase [Steroidobacteraceae bacterium]|nr:putative glycoside hydrolase [Steroidobacteraceae bacterium]
MDSRMYSNGRQGRAWRATLAGVALLWGASASAANYLEDFDDGQAQNWSFGSGWSVQGTAADGLYIAGPNTGSLTYSTYTGATWNTGYAYTVRLRATTSTGRVGAVFNYQNASNFYEVTVDQQNHVTLNRVLNGARTQLQQVTYPFSFSPLPNRYGDLRVERLGTNVTVRINGMVALTQTLMASQVFDGRVGVVTQNDPGQFDYTVVNAFNAPSGPDFPRLGSVRISPNTYSDPAVLDDLARTHVVLIGWDTTKTVPLGTIADEIHARSTRNTKVIVYTKMAVANFNNTSGERTEAPIHAKILAENWWVRDAAGVPIAGPHAGDTLKLVNISRFAKENNGAGPLTYSRWVAQWFVDNYYTPNPSIDGIYVDGVNWRPPANAASGDPTLAGDWDRDGTVDLGTREDVAQWFRRGFLDWFNTLGAGMPNTKLKFANVARWGQTTGGDNAELAEYYNSVHGGVLEQIIGGDSAVETWGGWLRMMETYRKIMTTMTGPRLAMFGHRLDTPQAVTQLQEMRYGLTSCLMDDGYYSPYINTYGSTPWMAEFDVNLGQATTAPPIAEWNTQHVWRRDFANGIAIVNPDGNGTKTVTVGAGFKKIDGTVVTSVTLPQRDGIILLRQ